jgi:hypothetical protein
MIDEAVIEIEPLIGTLAACRAIGASRAALYRRRFPPAPRVRQPRRSPARALADGERAVRGVLIAPPDADAERSHAREHAAHRRRGRPDSSRPLAGNRCHGAKTPAHEATTAVLTSMARRDERRPTCQTKMP